MEYLVIKKHEFDKQKIAQFVSKGFGFADEGMEAAKVCEDAKDYKEFRSTLEKLVFLVETATQYSCHLLIKSYPNQVIVYKSDLIEQGLPF